jgi:hypothetical protein
LAAVKLQELGIKDGYLFGIDIDLEDDGSGSVGVTTFIGDELFWWFVEDANSYAEYGFYR